MKKGMPISSASRPAFRIGGIPPAGHLNKPETFVDGDLLKYERIWAAAGTPMAIFALSPSDLVEMTGSRVIPIN